MATPADTTNPVDENASEEQAPELTPAAQDLQSQDGVELNLDVDPNDPRKAAEVPPEDVSPEPAEQPAKPDTSTGVPANAAAVHTGEGVVQHLDRDPNDPRNVPQPKQLPNFTDPDQQGPAPQE